MKAIKWIISALVAVVIIAAAVGGGDFAAFGGRCEEDRVQI